MPKLFKVFNLITSEEQLFQESEVLDCPIKALLAAFFQQIGMRNTGEYPALFEQYRSKVTLGLHSAGIGDLAIALPAGCQADNLCTVSLH